MKFGEHYLGEAPTVTALGAQHTSPNSSFYQLVYVMLQCYQLWHNRKCLNPDTQGAWVLMVLEHLQSRRTSAKVQIMYKLIKWWTDLVQTNKMMNRLVTVNPPAGFLKPPKNKQLKGRGEVWLTQNPQLQNQHILVNTLTSHQQCDVGSPQFSTGVCTRIGWHCQLTFLRWRLRWRTEQPGTWPTTTLKGHQAPSLCMLNPNT